MDPATDSPRSDRPAPARYLVTGALGCIGAWTVRTIARDGNPVVAFDLATDARRLAQITTPEELARITRVSGDITDLESIERVIDEHAISHVIHLAALQIPFCRADPPRGALVNVVGTVNVFEAVRRRAERMGPVVYAGSIGMYSLGDADPATGRLEADAVPHPATAYGVYKLANEGTARVYWNEHGLSSIGLRPMTVYGPGRDQGMTSTPTKAIAAAVLGLPYTISFGGRTLFQYAEDAARTFVIASQSGLQGAHTFNLGGSLAHLREFVAAIDAAVPGAGVPNRDRRARATVPRGDRLGGDRRARSGPGDAAPDGHRPHRRAVPGAPRARRAGPGGAGARAARLNATGPAAGSRGA